MASSFVMAHTEKHPKATKQYQELTGNGPVRIEGPKRVVHKIPNGGGLIPSQFVLHNQSVEAIVEVCGLVEEEASVFN